MPSGVTGHRSISSGMAWLREASCSSSRVMGPVVGAAGAVGSVGTAGAVGAGVATAAPSAVRRVLTLMLPVWAPGAVVSLEFGRGSEALVPRRSATGRGSASDVGLLGKYSWSLALALLDRDRWKKESLRENPSPTTRREWRSPCLGPDIRALATFYLVAGDCRCRMFDRRAVGLCCLVPASSCAGTLGHLIAARLVIICFCRSSVAGSGDGSVQEADSDWLLGRS